MAEDYAAESLAPKFNFYVALSWLEICELFFFYKYSVMTVNLCSTWKVKSKSLSH